MWTALLGGLPSAMTILFAFLAFAVPYAVYSFNQYLHKHGDPPWKKDQPCDED